MPHRTARVIFDNFFSVFLVQISLRDITTATCMLSQIILGDHMCSGTCGSN